MHPLCIERIRVRHNKTIGKLIRQQQQQQREKDILVDPAYHGNLGDTLLTQGEQTFFKHFNFQPKECQFVQCGKKCAVKCKQMFGQSGFGPKLAFWHAGGNWGDLWPSAQKARVHSMRQLLQHNFTVIGMPQSLFYQNEKNEIIDTRIFEKSVSTMSNIENRVILTWREQSSYEHAIKIYPFVKNLVVPDIAFQLGPFEPIRNNPQLEVDILFLLRDDKESVIASQRGKIGKLLPHNITYRVVDWNHRLKLFGSHNKLSVTTGIELLSLGRVVVCDRLHASILSYISGLPFVYLDQISQKVTKTLTTAFADSENCLDGDKAAWVKANSLQDAVTKAQIMLNQIGNLFDSEILS